MEAPDKGYRRIRDDLERYYDTKVNDKRILRICRSRGIKSIIKYSRHGCTRQAAKPQYIAENILDRKFYAERPNEKWLTDVTEFKYYTGIEVHKVYLSAILDLYDRRIVSFVVRDSNDWYLKRLTRHWRPIPMPTLSFIVTGDINTQTEPSITSWRRRE